MKISGMKWIAKFNYPGSIVDVAQTFFWCKQVNAVEKIFCLADEEVISIKSIQLKHLITMRLNNFHSVAEKIETNRCTGKFKPVFPFGHLLKKI